ncbi:MAG: LLM class flavin-dependent oxidoreductase [Thermoleophilia bacterium]|nr:LLM class flavin-dependent oxidoreductase [Thermoleophilia bacterium]
MELGIYSFGDATPNPVTGRRIDEGQRVRDLIEEIVLADEVGLDVFGVGEHHRADFPVSSPATVLAAAASRTSRIRLTSAVTVLSSDDPVRVFQDFATIDLISQGRAEIMAGRGSFIESFPLFGYDLDDYADLYLEKLDLLLALRDQEVVTWKGRLRPSIAERPVYPRPQQDPLPVWIAVGGTPQSVVNAAARGLPISLAIIGAAAQPFVPLITLYREALSEHGHDPATIPVGIGTHGFIATTSQRAFDIAADGIMTAMNQIGRERGWGREIDRAEIDRMRQPHAALMVGNPEEVAGKILVNHEMFGNRRALIHLGIGNPPHADMMRAIELYGTEVAPLVRTEVARRDALSASSSR